MVITDNETHYKRYFGMQDQGFSPYRKGSVMGLDAFVGLNFIMTELTAAVLLAQLRKLGSLLAHLRANKRRFKELISDLPGLEFREITDTDGECATLLTVLLPDEKLARMVASDLETCVVAETGWHVYSNMEQILQQRMLNSDRCPFTCKYYSEKGGQMSYRKGMLPQTDALLARAINISIGVSDPGLGSAFGVRMRDGLDQVDLQAERFHKAVEKYIG